MHLIWDRLTKQKQPLYFQKPPTLWLFCFSIHSPGIMINNVIFIVNMILMLSKNVTQKPEWHMVSCSSVRSNWLLSFVFTDYSNLPPTLTPKEGAQGRLSQILPHPNPNPRITSEINTLKAGTELGQTTFERTTKTRWRSSCWTTTSEKRGRQSQTQQLQEKELCNYR